MAHKRGHAAMQTLGCRHPLWAAPHHPSVPPPLITHRLPLLITHRPPSSHHPPPPSFSRSTWPCRCWPSRCCATWHTWCTCCIGAGQRVCACVCRGGGGGVRVYLLHWCRPGMGGGASRLPAPNLTRLFTCAHAKQNTHTHTHIHTRASCIYYFIGRVTGNLGPTTWFGQHEKLKNLGLVERYIYTFYWSIVTVGGAGPLFRIRILP